MLAPIHSRSHIITVISRLHVAAGHPTPAGLRDYAGAAERTAATARGGSDRGTSRRKSSSAAISDTIESLNTYLPQYHTRVRTHAAVLGSAPSARCPCALTQRDSHGRVSTRHHLRVSNDLMHA